MNYLLKFLRSLKKLPKIELVHAVCALQELTVKYFIYTYTYITLHIHISTHTEKKKVAQHLHMRFCQLCVL